MKTKLLSTLAVMAGLFLCVGVVSASDADVLQPAGATTSLESLRVGVAGQGGVTFFNGTVLNEGNEPFTIGDGLRVDGEIYRTEKGGSNPLKISDNVIPTLTNANNFGSADNRWKSVWAKNADFTGAVDFTGATVTGIDLSSPDAHNHDSRYYTKSQSDNKYALQGHNHDGRYYTESELNGGQLDSRYYTESQSNSRFVNAAGDTMSGKLDVNNTVEANDFEFGSSKNFTKMFTMNDCSPFYQDDLTMENHYGTFLQGVTTSNIFQYVKCDLDLPNGAEIYQISAQVYDDVPTSLTGFDWGMSLSRILPSTGSGNPIKSTVTTASTGAHDDNEWFFLVKSGFFHTVSSTYAYYVEFYNGAWGGSSTYNDDFRISNFKVFYRMDKPY